MPIGVLRLGHRFMRDARISTHIALTARAFGASYIVYDAKAHDVKKSVDSVTSIWGGEFEVFFTDNPVAVIRDFEGVTVHLTMYGLPIHEVLEKNPAGGDVIVVIGAEKVPPEIYRLADHNVAVGSQPHSEVAALAVFLDRLTKGEGPKKNFSGGKKIIPQKQGKKVV